MTISIGAMYHPSLPQTLPLPEWLCDPYIEATSNMSLSFATLHELQFNETEQSSTLPR